MNPKTDHYIALLSVLIVAAGCSHESAPRTQAQLPSTQRDLKSFIVTGQDEPYDSATPYSEVTLLSPHKTVLHLTTLKPGKAYRTNWRLTDAAGAELLSTSRTNIATDSNMYFWEEFKPNHKVHKPGRWKWTVGIEGEGFYSAEVMALPLTPSQLKDLAHYEQAREEVFNAFVRAWLGFNGDYFTAVTVDGRERDRLSSLLDIPPAELALRMTQPWNPGVQGTVVTKSQDMNNSAVLLQVKDLDYSFSTDFVSEADVLNGIAYKGHAEFGFRTYRSWTAARGWSEWKDSCRYGSVFISTLSRMVVSSVPSGFQGGFCLSYSFVKKDGHWRVTADDGTIFLNGKVMEQPAKVRDSESFRQKNLVWQPTLQAVRDLSSGLGFQRILDSMAGERSRATPEEISRNSILTMTMLRGRTL